MSGPNITDPAYTTLNTYAVLAATAITSPGLTVIENGFYGISPATPSSITGNYVGTLNNTTPGTAQSQLTTLIGDINTYTSTLTSVSLGTIAAPITLIPNTNYNSGSAITFQGIPITLDGQNQPNPKFFITAGTAITFNNIPSINLINGASTCNVFWLAGSAISFSGTMPPIIPGILIAGTSISFAASAQIAGRTYAKAAVTFLGNTGVDAICTTDPIPIIVCYLKGTLILTKEGFVPIEDIKAGQQVVTKGKIYKNKFVKADAEPQFEPVFWVSKFKVVDLNSKSRPICIKKNALGENRPFKDLYVSPGHSLLLNGRMVLAKNIVNGKTIYQDKECDNIEYYHLECERHSAIFANGVLSESYLDVNNRDVFENSVRLTRKFDLKKLNFLKK